MKLVKAKKQAEISMLVKEMDKIEKTIDNITIPALLEKKQNQWAELNQKKEELESSLNDITFDQTEYARAYNDAKLMLFSPVTLWDE
jgi:predicted  nucleic acid-binding Zn-ribbon protein